MRRVCLCIALLISTVSAANPALIQLKARYDAIERGVENTPTLTEQAQGRIPTQDTQTNSQIPDGEALIFTLLFNRHRLGEVFGINRQAGALLSLSDVARALDFPINVDTRSANGWIRSPKTSFTLSQPPLTEQWRAVLGDQTFDIQPESMLLEDDMYISTQMLEQWFDVEFELNYRDLEAKVTTHSPIPLERKLAREYRSTQLRKFDNKPKYPLKEYGYSPLSRPVLDLQFITSASESSPSTHSLSLLGANDLAYFNTQYYISTDSDNDLSDARFTATRYAPEASLLGPFNASEFKFGDVRASSISPLSTETISAGARVSNRTLTYQGGNTINLSGDIQPGWDVEIYRNQLLIASQLNVTGGQYYFPILPLVYGNNDLEIVFYGPQGQIQRDKKSYYVSSTGSTAGDFHYDVSVVDQGSQLLKHYTPNTEAPIGSAINARTSYAPTQWLNLYAGTKRFNDSNYSAQQATSYGSQLSLFGQALLSVDILNKDNGEYRRQYQLDSQWQNQSLSLISKNDATYDSDLNQWQSYRSNEIRVVGHLRQTPLSYSQSVERIEDATASYFRLTNQLGTRIRSSYITNKLSWQGNQNNLTAGNWQLQRYSDGFFWRFGNDYTLHPDTRIDNIFTEVSGDLSEHTNGRLSYIRNLRTQHNQTTASLSWRPNEFSLTTQLRYDDIIGWSASLLGQIGIGQTRSSTFTSNQTLVNRGSLSALVYHDRNNNGIYDQDDTPLPEVDVYSEQTTKRATTNAQGIAVLSSLTAFRQTDIDINGATLPDPYMIRRNQGISVSPKPGVVQSIEIPVVVSMEIEGLVSELSQGGQTTPLAYAPIEIRDDQGMLYQESLSEFDGYYLLSDLPPGNYTLQVKSDYLNDNGFLSTPPQSIRYTGENVVTGQDIIIRKAFNQLGYSAKLGQFASLATLKSYWSLLKTKHPPLEQQEFFYAQRDQSFTLYTGFASQRTKASSLCQKLSPSSCSVQRIRRQ